jgi:hypothetical protein
VSASSWVLYKSGQSKTSWSKESVVPKWLPIQRCSKS